MHLWRLWTASGENWADHKWFLAHGGMKLVLLKAVGLALPESFNVEQQLEQ
jgi:hypothetical protein